MEYKRIIQVEVTTSCQAACTFCPWTVLKTKWLSLHLAWDHFNPIMASLKKDTLVHLQGWGEPLLHPRFWDMAATVRQNKGRVSVTTNAMLMDEAASHEIVHIGMEFVAVSLADAECSGHNGLRAGTDLNQISANIEYLCNLKNRPRVHIAVQMAKSNLERLPGVVELAARLGADRVIASNLDCVVGPEVDALKIFGDTENPYAEEIVEAAKRRGREMKIEVEAYPIRVQNQLPVCTADPLRTTVITASGEIAPCTYLSLPLQGNIPRIFHGKLESVPRFVFGKAIDGVERTLRREPARSFLSMYKRRLRAATLNTAGNIAFLALSRARGTRRDLAQPGPQSSTPSSSPALPPAPDYCRFCYKLYGV